MPCKPKPPKSKKPMSERLESAHKKSASKMNIRSVVEKLSSTKMSSIKRIERPKKVIEAMQQYLYYTKSTSTIEKNNCLYEINKLNGKFDLLRMNRNKEPKNKFFQHFTKLEKAYAGEISKVVRTQPDLSKLHKEAKRITEIYLKEINKKYFTVK